MVSLELSPLSQAVPAISHLSPLAAKGNCLRSSCLRSCCQKKKAVPSMLAFGAVITTLPRASWMLFACLLRSCPSPSASTHCVQKLMSHMTEEETAF